MADISTIVLQVQDEATNQLKSFDRTLETTGAKAEVFEKKVNSIGQSASSFKALQKEIDQSTRLLGQLAAVTDTANEGNVQGIRELIDMQRRYAIEVGASAEQLLRITSIEQRFEGAVDASTGAIESNARSFGLMQIAAEKMDAERTRSIGLIQAEANAMNKAYDAAAQKSIRARALMEIEARAMDEARTRRRALLEAEAYEMDRARDAAGKATLSQNQLRGAFQSLAIQLTGLNPSIGRLTGMLGVFAIGSSLMAGVLAGVAALSFAYDKLTADSREAQKAADDLTKSLLEQRKAALEATNAGREGVALQTLQTELKAQQDLARVRRETFSDNVVIRLRALLALPQAEKNAANAAAAADQVRVNSAAREAEHAEDMRQKRMAADRAIADFQTAGGEQLKRIDDERLKRAKELARESEESLKRQIQLANNLAGRFDATNVLGNIDARLGANAPTESGAGMTLEELKQMFADFHRGQSQRRDDRIYKESDKAAGFLEKLGRSAQIASQALEYYLVSKIGGGGPGASLGAGLAKGALSDFAGGFAKTALGSAIFNPIAAGVGAFVGGLFDSGRAAKEHARAFTEAAKQLSADLATFHARATGTEGSLDDQIASARRDADRLRQGAAVTLGSPAWRTFFPNDLQNTLDQINEDEAAYVAKLKEEFRIKREQTLQDFEARRLAAQGQDDAAAAIRQQIADERELAEARKLGIDEAIVKEVQKAEAQKRYLDEQARAADELRKKYEELVRAQRGLRSNLVARGLSALGNTREAEDIRFAIQAQQEMEDAIKQGMSPSTLAMLAFVQLLERNQTQLQRQVQDQTDALQATAKSLDKQESLLRDQLSVSQDQLRTQERAAQESRRVFESLVRFSAGLKLNTSLSILSPIDQLAEARRQYQSLVGLAGGGDKNAAEQLPDSAQAFLEASRAVNASGPGFVSDFKDVQDTLASITDKFGTQATVEEKILAELQSQSDALEAQLKALDLAKTQAQESAATQIDALQKQIAEQQRQYAESFKFYADFRQIADNETAMNIRYFGDMVNKLGGILEQTFRTAENTSRIEPPKSGPILEPFLPVFNTGFQSLYNLTQAGIQQTVQELTAVKSAIQENTLQTRRSMERLS